MSETIDRLKIGLAEAQARHAEITKRHQAVTAEWQASNAEVTGYMKVLEVEARRELEKAASVPPIEGPASKAEHEADRDSNKTQLVRDALALHPGLTPAQVWGAVKTRITRRTYVYSVLKRLKDRKQIVERRGKYYLPEVPKMSEVTEQTTLQ
jgi:hypothetical protein